MPILEVEYAPSSLEQLQDANLMISDPRGTVSDWVYTVSGRGDAPSIMEPVIVYSAVNVRASATFSFRNPFPEAITVHVEMQIDDTSNNKGGSSSDSNAFTLLLKQPDCNINAFGNLQIPFIFVPTSISEYNAMVVIERPAANGNGSLRWQYPISGVAEAPPGDDGHKIMTQARESIRQIIKLPLYGLTEEECALELSFDHNLEVMDDNLKSMIARSVSIYPESDEHSGSMNGSMMNGSMNGSMASMNGSRASLNQGSRSGGNRGSRGAIPFLSRNNETGEECMYVSYIVEFLPLKPFKAPCELIVSKASGGRWRHAVMLESTEPEVDDIIVIEALLNSTSSVSFKLTNQYAAYAPFTATFTPDSPYEFTCFPNEGVLEPPGRGDGTVFIVSFTPTEYGKTQIGKLVIQTEEMQWTYEIRGIPPEYKAPDGIAVVSSRMDRSLTKNLGKAKRRNYMKSNMAVTKRVAENKAKRYGSGRRK